MKKGKHMYVRTGQLLYPLLNFVVRGDKNISEDTQKIPQYEAQPS